MMNLFIYEFQKLIYAKLTIMVSMFILLVSISNGIIEVNGIKDQVGNLEKYNELSNSYEGSVNEERVQEIEKKITTEYQDFFIDGEVDKNLDDDLKVQIALDSNYLGLATRAQQWESLRVNGEYSEASLKGLEERVTALEDTNEIDSYKYKNAIKELNMMKEAGKPTYYNNKIWGRLLSFLGGIPNVAFVITMLIVIVCPIFSNEYKNGMQRIIYSTKNGQCQIVKAKIAAAMVFIIMFITIYYLVNLLTYLIGGKALTLGYAKVNCLSGFQYTPFNWACTKMLFIGYLTTLVSACTLVAVFSLISSLCKKNLTSVFIAVVIVILPFLGQDSGFIATVMVLFPSVTLSFNKLFESYLSYNIFNVPVLYPIVAIAVLMVVLVVAVICSLFTYSQKIRH